MGSEPTRLLQHYRRLAGRCDIRVSTNVDRCTGAVAPRARGWTYLPRVAGERFMKIVRVCLFLLALWPAWGLALDAGPAESPLVEGVQCSGNVATSCELVRSQAGIAVGRPLDESQ